MDQLVVVYCHAVPPISQLSGADIETRRS
jgi:hypothetical protein